MKANEAWWDKPHRANKHKSNYKNNVQNVSINGFRKLCTVSKKFQRETGFAKLKFNYGVGWLWALDATWHDQFHGARYHTPPCTTIITRNQFQDFLLFCFFNCTSLHAMSEKALLTWRVASFSWTQKFIFISKSPKSWWNISGFLFNFSM